MGKWTQLKLLVWKNLLIQKKHKLATAFEIGLPALFVIILVIIRKYVHSVEQCTDNPNPKFGGYCDYTLFTPAMFPLIPPCTNFSNCDLKLAFTPNSSKALYYMESVRDYYGIHIEGYKSEKSMLDVLKNRSNSVMDIYSDYVGGVVFNFSDPMHINYTIRLDAVPRLANHSAPPVKDWRTRWVYPVFQIIGPRELNNSFGGDPGYFREGFIAIQHAIDRAVIMQATRKAGKVPLDNSTFPRPVVMKRFPYPKFDLDGFIYILENTMPFLFLIAFQAMNINCVRRVVAEKEKRIKEAMKIMGLSGWVHWVAWYIEIVMVMIIPVIIITIAMKVGNIVPYSDGGLIFFFLFAYMLSSIAFSFLISCFFSRANVAAGAAGVFWFLNYTPYFFIQQFYESMSFPQKWGVSILSNTAMGIGAKVIAAHEAAEIGVQWGSFLSDPLSGDITFGSVVLILLGDMVLYIVMTWYIENVFPGEFGIPKKFYFPFTPSYWGFCQSEPLVDLIINETTPLVTGTTTSTTAVRNNGYYEEVPANMDPVVDILDLTKIYPGKTVKAVDGLNLQLYKGQIFALLGHNGAGKTTTISVLTGLYQPTKGTAYILGRDIRTNIESIRKQIGYCPQYNVLFDELTVDQHLVFFARLKGAHASTLRYDVDNMIRSLGLEDKRHEVSKNLSGGMKRKLSCANALIGNSKIVFLDEPTSGMDPAARRSTWDLLLKYKTDKTIVLTTHYMDEADLLGDRIGIMAKGSMCCVGSSLYLKKHFGIGYHMTIVKNDKFQSQIMNNFVTSYIAGSKMEGNVAAEVSFLLPEDQVCNFDRFFTELEREQDNLGVQTYGLSITTLEEVFMRVEELDGKDVNTATKVANEILTKARKNVAEILKGESSTNIKCDEGNTKKRSRAVQIRDHFNKGKTLALQQIRAMFIKRWYYSVRNIKTLIMQFLMPLVFTMIPLIVIKIFPTQKAAPALQLSALTHDNMFAGSQIAYEEANSTNYNGFITSLQEITNTSLPGGLLDVQEHGYGNLTWFILDKIKKTHGQFNRDFVFGFSALQDTRYSEDVTMIWFNNKPYHSIPTAMNLYTNTYLNQMKTGISVSTTNMPLPPSTQDKVNNINNQIFAFMVAFNVLFGFAFLASSFVIFIVKERISGARHLQMLSGLNPVVYWCSAFVWDLLNFLLPACSLLILFHVFRVDAFTGDNLPIVFLLEMLYGYAVIPLMYLLGKFFKNEVVAYTRLIMLNIITGTGAVLVVFILSIPALGLVYVNDTLKWILIFLPNFDLGQALGDMYLNYQIKTACEANPHTRLGCLLDHIKWQNNYMAWDSPGIGRYLIWLAMMGTLNFSLVLLLEYTSIFKRFRKKEPQRATSPNPNENEDVKVEREVVQGSEDFTVRVLNLTKLYDTGKTELTAVDHLSIGIPSKETFGLLGVNGAGKTSTFRMLTGDLPITSGSATICGYDVATNINKARQFIGYCPQFDALIDCMTAREHLVMYARLRGVPEETLNSIVERTLNELALLHDADYHSCILSGGNKRKLSTAIALVGYPPVVFLDEPTSGLDVVARRSLWAVVSKIRKLGTAIILTSHSMEECEALCTRLAIMVNGQLKCIGTLQELKSKYGMGYNVQIKVRTTADGEPDKTALYGFVRCHFPEARLEEEHHGLLSYIIPKSNRVTWANIFSLLERHKEQAKIQDYSVSQTTLEQVFLSFARAQREEE